ncbi:E3 ubiquitin-protein ligase RGLG4-like [Prunus avium]|uniref:E3 ubiquitin-protein ligase RGLG4-like n=1 Tax=Prunus avium TaxID=42229 RepID=A0A6P5SX59_PRUAV|nr:E3 ubiquitin-protein ligase RGLG4-like [Prunus avium]
MVALFRHLLRHIEKLKPINQDDNLISPGFCFGNAKRVPFRSHSNRSPCKRNDIQEVLSTSYDRKVRNVPPSGPISYAPAIDYAVDIVEQKGGRFQTLFLVADNKVTKNFFNTSDGELSTEGAKTIESIVNASSYALSIVLVGTDDGCWEHMKKFQEMIPKRKFDNFQFVNFTEILPKDGTLSDKEAAFAHAALEKLPAQHKAAVELGLVGCDPATKRRGKMEKSGFTPPKIHPPTVDALRDGQICAPNFIHQMT